MMVHLPFNVLNLASEVASDLKIGVVFLQIPRFASSITYNWPVTG